MTPRQVSQRRVGEDLREPVKHGITAVRTCTVVKLESSAAHSSNAFRRCRQSGSSCRFRSRQKDDSGRSPEQDRIAYRIMYRS